MEKLYKIKDALWNELDKSETARSGELKGGELEAIHKLTDTIKNIDKICMLEEEGGYSENGQSYEGGGSYGGGSSYANRGQHYVRGHYSREGGNMGGGQGGYSSRGGRGGYSRDDGRSEMMEHIEMAIDSADDRDLEKIKRFMRELENA